LSDLKLKEMNNALLDRWFWKYFMNELGAFMEKACFFPIL